MKRRKSLAPARPLRISSGLSAQLDAHSKQELSRELAAVRRQLGLTTAALERERRARVRLPRLIPAARKFKLKGDRIRVCVGDLHGAKQCSASVAAFLGDLRVLAPHEIILGGDIADCGGFLAQHHTLGYVAETEYSYEQDIACANNFLDAIQRIAPRARIEYLEGNHERRVETWCITQTLRHQRDSEMLRRAMAPEFLLHLKQRSIAYFRLSECYDGLSVPGIIHRDKCYYFHGITTAKHAAAMTLIRSSGNSVYFHTHRAQSDIQRRISVGIIGAWNPGALCGQQPLWQHGSPTDWTNGHAVQFISRTGRFLHLNVPIIEGHSDLTALLKQ